MISLSYKSASSGLKEKVLTCIFVQNIDLYNIIVYISRMLCTLDGSSLKILMVGTYIRYQIYLFILFIILFYFIHETSCKHRCYHAEVI